MSAPPGNREGQSTARPPLFNGQYYSWWKNRMRDQIIGEDYELWDIVTEGPLATMKKNAEGQIMVETIGDGDDRISELPIHIIYDILRRIRYRYGQKEEARICVLSKTWSSIWRLRPDVIIDQHNHKNFVNFVDDSLRPYAEQNLRIETLSLQSLDLDKHPEMASHIDRWLNLAIKHNVRSLEISLACNLNYSIPDAIYAAKTLTELLLHGCNFEIDNSTTNKLQRLISMCPFIRDLNISNCTGIKNLCVSSLVNLEILELWRCEGLEKLEIQAPNLRKFIYGGVPLHKYQRTREPELLPCKINILDGYKTLQILKLEATTMTDQEFECLLSKFSALEVLELEGCYVMKNIKVVSEKLKSFTLWNWTNQEQVNMMAPNLMEFKFFSGKTCMPFSTMDPSNLELANIIFYPDCSNSWNFGDMERSWYSNLQDFVQKFNYSNGLDKNILICEDPIEIIVPPTRKLELWIKNPWMYPEKFAHDLITRRPNIISIVPCTESKMVQ
uniref:FBD-associated F-box protein At5g56560 n=1 Tax=Nicotiana tabacum TaxID=4097 RepID=A0A1S3ZR10_TOBAC